MAREIQDLLANDTARARCIDVIIVTYNRSEHVRRTVRPLTGLSDVQVIVVDNNSSDETLEAVMDLPIEVIPLESNVGFAAGCNIGWRRGSAPFVLFLNPDACIEADALCTLTSALASQQRVGAVGPLITDPERRLDFSQRRFPRLLSTWARALFLHRLAPGASWSDETIRDKKAYESAHSAEWLSGACLLVRRDLRSRSADSTSAISCIPRIRTSAKRCGAPAGKSGSTPSRHAYTSAAHPRRSRRSSRSQHEVGCSMHRSTGDEPRSSSNGSG